MDTLTYSAMYKEGYGPVNNPYSVGVITCICQSTQTNKNSQPKKEISSPTHSTPKSFQNPQKNLGMDATSNNSKFVTMKPRFFSSLQSPDPTQIFCVSRGHTGQVIMYFRLTSSIQRLFQVILGYFRLQVISTAGALVVIIV